MAVSPAAEQLSLLVAMCGGTMIYLSASQEWSIILRSQGSSIVLRIPEGTPLDCATEALANTYRELTALTPRAPEIDDV